MSFISYAQNFEDVMLWRALKHVDRGFYVDVGAQDPELDSVSKAFYDRGWSGINIEPVPFYAERLLRERPRDLTLACAASDVVAEEPLYIFPDTGLSTLQRDQALLNRTNGRLDFTETTTSSRPLRDILEEAGVGEVHWLKVDVEGFELQVLRGWQGSTVLPWIIIVESTRPNEATQVHGDWESILLDAGYTFVYFDGLNRFYLAAAHQDLGAFFRHPPNVFDDFKLAAVGRAETAFQSAEEFAHSLEPKLADATAYAESLARQVSAAETHAAALQLAYQTQLEHGQRFDAELQLHRDSRDRLELHARHLEQELRSRSDAFETLEAYAKSLETAIENERAGRTAVETRLTSLSSENGELHETYRLLAEHLTKSTTEHQASLDALRLSFEDAEKYAKSLEAEIEKRLHVAPAR